MDLHESARNAAFLPRMGFGVAGAIIGWLVGRFVLGKYIAPMSAVVKAVLTLLGLAASVMLLSAYGDRVFWLGAAALGLFMGAMSGVKVHSTSRDDKK